MFFDTHWITGVMVGIEFIEDPDYIQVVVDLGILRIVFTKGR
ncbi:hypothetical protein ACC754_35115 [Rhizobium johnstonii]